MRRTFLPVVIGSLLLSCAAVAAALSDSPVVSSRTSGNRTTQKLRSSPPVTLWAWERDEDLSFIDPEKVKVAYFAGNIFVRGELVKFRPRVQKLVTAKGSTLMPVFRIESVLTSNKAEFPTAKTAELVARTIVDSVGKTPNFRWVQVDFDATKNEREFYITLLHELRRRLPANIKISITSLASWLLDDKWLPDGICDEAVAMMFSLGPDKDNVLARIKSTALNPGNGIDLAIGISANEKRTNQKLFAANLQRSTDKLFIFNSRPWTRARYQAIINEAFE